ncbi:MAG: phenylalanine--tRNA ligase subunit alpha [Myxococcales bacterium]|nr:phenylalanine--tRNA ligase subunit alpha [Myxococcales bacterium]MCB9644904.1 phenylalanine--tRNA ligase subunit alpha [Myxococcales bacterium]
MARQLATNAYKVLKQLEERGGRVGLDELVAGTGLDQSQVMAVATAFAQDGWIDIAEEIRLEISLDEEGTAFLQSGASLLERRAAEALRTSGQPMTTVELAEATGTDAQAIGKVMRYLTAKGYATRAGKALQWADGADLEATQPDESLLARIAEAPSHLLLLGAEESAHAEIQEALKGLRSRNYLRSKERKFRELQLADEGKKVVQEGFEELVEVNQLTEAMLLSGEWRNVSFRSYDVTLDTTPTRPGKLHPLRRVLEETRRAFLNLGFQEIRGPYVESAFWDFDALFQPQDHPAREMQDTFYCERPGQFELPDPKMVETIRRTHEDGGDTGSTGWRYKWSEQKARQVVLRTHTTAVTVAACHKDPSPPQKVFCVGRVFRRETIDWKHLPEFHQVDGVIIDKDASFASLLGTLTAFYKQMGFDEVKFRPDFFPYTEPSVGVFVRLPGAKDWFELGGAGVFRPEVVQPAGVDVPVLAWGLGLERLAMVRYQIEDIRQLYLSQLDWLKESALHR